MTAEFKTWVARVHAKLPADVKGNFLYMLKFAPGMMLSFINVSLYEWRLAYMSETGKMPESFDKVADSGEILEFFQTHFAKELEAIKDLEEIPTCECGTKTISTGAVYQCPNCRNIIGSS